MIDVYVDGASSGNPGPSGAGIFIKGAPDGSYSARIPLGVMTNHEAEYHALIHALRICSQKGYKIVSFRTDSQLVEQAVEKEYVKKNLYQPLLQEILVLKDELDLFFLKWIPSSQNKNADKLAREAIQLN